MGVAMVVLWPMLYTDTSESWKLANPRQRLAIASAGMIAELALAGLATLAWSLRRRPPAQRPVLPRHHQLG
jgi:putative peptide zinc metalloprotease protein